MDIHPTVKFPSDFTHDPSSSEPERLVEMQAYDTPVGDTCQKGVQAHRSAATDQLFEQLPSHALTAQVLRNVERDFRGPGVGLPIRPGTQGSPTDYGAGLLGHHYEMARSVLLEPGNLIRE